jgi:hypothetical protein
MPRPSNPSLSDHRIKVLWREKQTLKSLISSKRTSLQLPGTSSFLGPNEVLCTPRHPQSMFCYNVVAGQVSLPHETTVKLKCLHSNLYLSKFLSSHIYYPTYTFLAKLLKSPLCCIERTRMQRTFLSN